jgi:hypothetical protein
MAGKGSGRGGRSGRRQVVSQAELATFLETTRQLRVLEQRRDRLRQRLLRAHEDGTPVERGALVLEVVHRHQRRLPLDKVAEVLGDRGLKDLLRQVGLTEVVHVVVIEVGQGARAATAAARPVA